ncbi:integrase arm-type DNA-binding domain-containing protein [Shewanella sp. D64]|uniref:integrase arm-type DNA-binding domain-containing protein n=1 Tax=unclassified Shewanella TaxID=196818 RepID=UPI0022BA247B|nr:MULTISPECIES: integrase arm-type DNA-binding domain-containing protein [unclassified Shewanella]MEC4726041.1 integrase arm-type DNA-binding domain-containing protein [Shewanella sp. D64]MEC4738042.1 integrase arm-type DNA-binding domain-containing protein [Shewanella sp. E94]WBJ96236.1 integrase arm-type DNA-binding domain-containing protein [Shewanella sp. MTB7]
MAKKVTPLTNTQVKQAKPKDKEYSINDGDGLALRVRPNGGKSWFFTYVVPVTKKRFKISFGSYPDVTLAQARRKRDESRSLVAAEVDPQKHKALAEAKERNALENTFQSISNRWLLQKQETKQQSTYLKRERLLAKYLFPQFALI